MDDQRIRVDSRQVEIVLEGGTHLTGELFLQLHGLHQPGPQRVSEVINSDETFLPVRTGGGVKLINIDQVIAVYTAAADEFDPLLELGEEHSVRVTTVLGDSLKAQIFVNLPNDHNRAKDFLNQQKRFLLFLLGEKVAYLARKKIIMVENC
jgi:hypothetical protein